MKILLAVDGSPCSEAAVETLIHQHKPSGAEVLILHVVESFKMMPMSFAYGAGPTFTEHYTAIAQQRRQEGEELVDGLAKRLQAAGFKRITKVEDGDARERILEYANKWHADLILLGSHGRRGLGRFLLGSVSETVARHAPCSVEIVRAQSAPA